MTAAIQLALYLAVGFVLLMVTLLAVAIVVRVVRSRSARQRAYAAAPYQPPPAFTIVPPAAPAPPVGQGLSQGLSERARLDGLSRADDRIYEAATQMEAERQLELWAGAIARAKGPQQSSDQPAAAGAFTLDPTPQPKPSARRRK